MMTAPNTIAAEEQVLKVHYITCALSSSLDGKTNRLSLFHVMDEIVATSFPMVLPSFCVAALFEREADDASMPSFIMAVTLDGTLLASFTLSADFNKSRRSRAVNTIQGLSLPGPGLAVITLMQKARVLAEWRVQVVRSDVLGKAVEAGANERAEAGPQADAPKNALAVN